MNIPFVDFTREWAHFEKQFTEAFQTFGAKGQYVLGPTVEHFESEFAAYHGYAYGIGVSTGLAALEVALRAYGIGDGDEVITVANSAVATALAISRVGAKPVFCDIGDDFLIDPPRVESLITDRTKAILPVHLFGKIGDMIALDTIAQEHHLFLIEDACQAHGASFSGISAKYTKAFSFYPTKNLGAMGEGGMIVTNDSKIRDFAASYRNYGQNGRYIHEIKGANYRINALQCVLLSIKLREFESTIEKRRQIAKRYIGGLGADTTMTILPYDGGSAYHLFVLRVHEGKRNILQSYLRDHNIETLIHYPTAIHKQPCYQDEYRSVLLPKTDEFQNEILSLPCYPFLKDTEQEYIIKAIQNFSV